MGVLGIDIGIKNLAVCYINDGEILLWKNVDIIDGKKVKSFTLQELTILAHKSLSEILENVKDCDNIFIENQPSFNSKMKFMSNIVFSHLVSLFPLAIVRFENAKTKLKNIEGDKKTYTQRKKLAVSHTSLLVSEKFTSHLEFFSNSKVKADLADAFLICCYK